MCYTLYLWFLNFVHFVVFQSEHSMVVVFFGMQSHDDIL
jgi:hypothetical protein